MSADDQERAAVLERWFAAYNAHDIEALCEIADPDVEVIPLAGDSVPPGTSYHGRPGLRSLLTAGFERFPSLQIGHSPPKPSGGRLTVELEFALGDGSVKTASCDYNVAGGRIRQIRAYDPQQSVDPNSEAARVGLLSPRERQVLSLIAAGNTVGEVAQDLVLSPLTVRTHVRNAKDKLQARTTAHAVAIALDEHVLDV